MKYRRLNMSLYYPLPNSLLCIQIHTSKVHSNLENFEIYMKRKNNKTINNYNFSI